MTYSASSATRVLSLTWWLGLNGLMLQRNVPGYAGLALGALAARGNCQGPQRAGRSVPESPRSLSSRHLKVLEF
jgi:hypothetical protein